MLTTAAEGKTRQGWLGQLQLDFAGRHGRTELVRRRHEGPLLVQRTFHPEGEVCHSYIIHPPGGVVGGDRLRLDVNLSNGAQVLITTPAAAKFYRSNGPTAEQVQHFNVPDRTALEFLPTETILHGACRVALRNVFSLRGTGRLCTWDVLCLGRPGSGDRFEGGRCDQEIRVERDGEPLLHDRLRLVHGDAMLSAPWGLAGYSVLGTLLATPAEAGLAQLLRDSITPRQELRLGITCIRDVLLVRCLGNGAEVVRDVMQQAWALLREPVLGRVPCPPRIWKT